MVQGLQQFLSFLPTHYNHTGHQKTNIGEVNLKHNEANGVYFTAYGNDPLPLHQNQQFHHQLQHSPPLPPHTSTHIDYGTPPVPVYEEHHHHGIYHGYNDGGGASPSYDIYGGSSIAAPYHRGHSDGHYHNLLTHTNTAYETNSAAAAGALHKPSTDFSYKRLLAKSFLIPLASAAVLGIAAALVSNPLLLQLGTVSGVGPSLAGKRRRRRRRRRSADTLRSPYEAYRNRPQLLSHTMKTENK